jgi:AbrB family looped-hinge helix DNA binding protein
MKTGSLAGPPRQISAAVTQRGQVTIPAEVRQKLGVRMPDRVTFVIDGDEVRIESAPDLVEKFFGSVKPLPGREHIDIDEVYGEELEARADRILQRMNEE